jgi:hypothetical protein
LLGFQGGLTSGSLGGLCSGQGSSLLSFNGQLGGCSLSDTRIASDPDRVPCRPPLDSGRALGRRPGSGRPFQLGLLRVCRCAQAVGETALSRRRGQLSVARAGGVPVDLRRPRKADCPATRFTASGRRLPDMRIVPVELAAQSKTKADPDI